MKKSADKTYLFDSLQHLFERRRAKKEHVSQNKYDADQKLVLFTLQQTGALKFIPQSMEKKAIDDIRMRWASEYKNDRGKTLIGTALEVSNALIRAQQEKMTTRTASMFVFGRN